MTLQAKTGLLLFFITILLGLSHIALQRAIVSPAILELEESFAQKDMERCVEALDRQLHKLDRMTEDWAAWEESSTFIQDIDLEYIISHLLKDSFVDNNIHLIYYLDNEGWKTWGKIYGSDFNEEIFSLNFPHQFRVSNPLLQHGADQTSSGAFLTEHGPMLIAARPIMSSEQKGSPIGTLIMGQFINQELIDTLISQTRVVLKITPFNKKNTELQPIINQINTGSAYPITPVNDSLLHAYATFPGMNNQPTLLLQGEIERQISTSTQASQRKFILLMGMSSLILFISLLVILDKSTFHPLQTLVHQTSEIRHQMDVLSRLPDQNRTDEIGSLTREMNHLLDFQYKATETLEKNVEDRTLELSASNHLLQTEISQHHKTQEEFRRLNDELEAIFNTSRVGIMLLRGGRRLDKCNKRLAEIYGYDSPEDMKQISMEKLHLSEERFLDFGKKYYLTLQQGAQIQVEYEFRKKDGTKIWCLVSGMAMDTAMPPDIDKGVTWVVDDITERKEEEHKLAEHAKMQGMFATIGGVCHELGQPVQIISAHTQILNKHNDLNQQQMKRIKSIYEQTERMGNILKKLQGISKFETTDYVAGLEILDINKSAEKNSKDA